MATWDEKWPESRPLPWRVLAVFDWRARLSRFWGGASDVILVYHSIGGESAHSLDLSTEQFDKHVRTLSERYQIVDIARILADPNTAQKRVVLTFDDGFENVYTNALPVLQKYGVPATVLVCPDLIENSEPGLLQQRHSLPEGTALDVLSQGQLEELAKSELITIGNHTGTHSNLATLSTEEARKEIVESKSQLERLINTDVTRFSYPYGAVTEKAEQLVKKTYEIAFTSEPNMLSTRPVPHHLPRLDACLPVEVLSFEMTEMAYTLRRLGRRLNLG